MFMSCKRDLAIVVDGYSSGTQIAPAFRAKGVECVHVRSVAEVTDDYGTTFKAHDFIDNFLFSDISSLRSKLTGRNVRWVVPGSELGVDLAATLADTFETELRNDGSRAECWRNKFKMHEALHHAGVRAIPHILSKDKTEIMAWVDRVAGYPVVIKPKASSGTDNIHICQTREDLAIAFDAVMGALDAFLVRNTDVLAQVFLENEPYEAPEQHDQSSDVEYCVNTVSLDGEHFVSDVIKVYRVRMGDNPVHDYNELLCPVADAEAYDVFGSYIGEVLDTLGIKNGPAHSEIMVVKGQPVLLEAAARMPGSNDMSAYSKALGISQVELWMLACTDQDAFRVLARRPRVPLRYHSSCVFLISEISGKITQQPDISQWTLLPELHSASLQNKGSLLRTTDLNNVPGYVFLLAKDRAVLPARRAALRAAEQGIYRQMTAPICVEQHKVA
ncbi:MAG: hypothetical protein ABJQ34_19035 [Paracoccaceae bacterium]